MDSPSSPDPLVVITHDSELLERILSITAAVPVDPLVLRHPAELRPHWLGAAMILIGVDLAPAVAAVGLPRRAEVYLAADETVPSAMADGARWSVPLGAALIGLPGHAGWLADALADVAGRRTGAGRIVVVLGGSGGVGASTLAAGLAVCAGRDGDRTLLIDADPRGGGIDLLLGAERFGGWRWPRLAGARGHLGDLSAQLPLVDEVHVLAMARGEPVPEWELGAEPLTAVLESATRSHDRIVVDTPRSLGPGGWAALEPADLVVAVVSAHVHGVAAAGEALRSLDLPLGRTGVVVRSGRHRPIPPEVVAGSVELPLIAAWPDDPTVVMAAERGEPPGRSPRTPLAEVCASVWLRLPTVRERVGS